jgi:hypothetical protein
MTLHVNLSRWEPHVLEARRLRIPLKSYATERGLSIDQMYKASQAMRLRDAGASVPGVGTSPFVPVVMGAPNRAPCVIRVTLPNRATIEVNCSSGDEASWRAWFLQRERSDVPV